MKRIWNKLKIYIKPFFDIRFLISYGLVWLPLHGWIYFGLLAYPWHHNTMLFTIATTTQAILYMPWCNENIIQIPIALWIEKKLFKNEKTEKILNDMLSEAKHDLIYWKDKIKGVFHMEAKYCLLTNDELMKLGYSINFTNDYLFKFDRKTNESLCIDNKTREIETTSSNLLSEIKYEVK